MELLKQQGELEKDEKGNAMFRMKENWSFLHHRFEDSDRLWKQLRKTTDLNEYRRITSEMFHRLPLKDSFDPQW